MKELHEARIKLNETQDRLLEKIAELNGGNMEEGLKKLIYTTNKMEKEMADMIAGLEMINTVVARR